MPRMRRSEDIVPAFFTSALDGDMSVHLHALAALPPGEELPVPIPFPGARNLTQGFGGTLCNASNYRGQ